MTSRKSWPVMSWVRHHRSGHSNCPGFNRLRRQFLRNAFCITSTMLVTPLIPSMAIGRGPWVMPDEGMPHKRTWMAFGASQKIWGKRLLSGVQKNLAELALAISDHEPVSMLVREEEYDLARSLTHGAVDLVISPLDDLWIRDTGPGFVQDSQGKKAGIDFNFNGWGGKQIHIPLIIL